MGSHFGSCLSIFLVFHIACAQNQGRLVFPDERFFSNVQQLTFTGRNTFPKFSDDGTKVIYTAREGSYGTACDQVYRFNLQDIQEVPSRISTTLGVSENPSFWPGSNDVLYESNFPYVRINSINSTHSATLTCPTDPCKSLEVANNQTLRTYCTSFGPIKNVVYGTDIFRVNKYGNIVNQVTAPSPSSFHGNDTEPVFYRGEPAVSLDQQWIVHSRYMPHIDSIGLYVQNTSDYFGLIGNMTGYFGGAVFSPDGKKIVFHGYDTSDPLNTSPTKAQFNDMMNVYKIIPQGQLQLYMVNIDGTNLVKLTNDSLGSTFPRFVADSNKIIYTSRANSTYGYSLSVLKIFDLNTNRSVIVSTTQGLVSTAWASFNTNGTKIVFSSNRNSGNPADYQLFIADFKWMYVPTMPVNRSHIHEENSVEAKEEEQEEWQNKKTPSFDGVVHFPGEIHFANVKQLTFGGENAEGYFSLDDKLLTLQATGYGTGCDQIYQLDLRKDPRTQTLRRMSTGLGVCTCSYFFENNKDTLYAGTFASVKINTTSINDASCPLKTCSAENLKLKNDPKLTSLCNASYTWDIYPEFDIYKINEYGNIIQRLTDTPGYDAEGVLSPDGKLIAFTSLRGGDLDLWIMNSDGTNVRQITNVLGYDGGSFFSPDGKRLIFRASRPNTTEEIKKYKELLSYNIVEPVKMELFYVDIETLKITQITHLGGANWAPYYLNDNRRVIFSSDHAATAGFGAFDLWLINDDGTGLERVTYDNGMFDSFPMMNYAGTKLVWGSSRNASSQYDINLFLGDWIDPNITSSSTTVAPQGTTLVQRSQTSQASQSDNPKSAPGVSTKPGNNDPPSGSISRCSVDIAVLSLTSFLIVLFIRQ